MNVNERGVKGLIKVIDDLQEKGYYTFIAFDDHSPIDLVAVDKNGRTFKLQVKFRSLDKSKEVQRYALPASSVVNRKRTHIDKSLLDGWAVFLKEHKKVVYISKKEFGDKVHFTIDPNKDYGELSEWSIVEIC